MKFLMRQLPAEWANSPIDDTTNERLLEWLQSGKSITALESFNQLGIMRLASRVCDLKKQGYEIKSEMVSVCNRFNEKCSVKRYWL